MSEKLKIMPVHHRSHGNAADFSARHGGGPNVARDGGRGKATYEVQVNPGMTSTRNGKTYADPMSHEMEANPARPTNPGPYSGPKRLSRPAIYPGMRSRQDPALNDAKMTALSEALIRGALHDPQSRALMNLGHGHNLPGTIDDN
jgi:hypothetical protein